MTCVDDLVTLNYFRFYLVPPESVPPCPVFLFSLLLSLSTICVCFSNDIDENSLGGRVASCFSTVLT